MPISWFVLEFGGVNPFDFLLLVVQVAKSLPSQDIDGSNVALRGVKQSKAEQEYHVLASTFFGQL